MRGFAIDTWDEIQIGATIGVHTGPYPLGVGILRSVRDKKSEM